ncbi:hypothetical protein [Montanilutibacter psychrotolerans]|uniref:Transmembrane protein n=1 Tax=Montanilutibacter psychrotolerans TaxID=1327343 RepID=A0A3M8SMQ7_9GAMM|nr:hypothetical protein [Lysobacter psychrotolerans]RNF82601.1 hypothetical protein EER27_13935 [Lysobacter psychrotolerans]
MRSIAHALASFLIAALIGGLLAVPFAPDDHLAWLIGAALMAIGVIAAYKGIEAVALLFAPLLLAQMGLRKLRGQPMLGTSRGPRREWGWRLLFTIFYAMFAFLTGIAVAAFPGGHGPILGALAFGMVGLLYGALVSYTVIRDFGDAP